MNSCFYEHDFPHYYFYKQIRKLSRTIFDGPPCLYSLYYHMTKSCIRSFLFKLSMVTNTEHSYTKECQVHETSLIFDISMIHRQPNCKKYKVQWSDSRKNHILNTYWKINMQFIFWIFVLLIDLFIYSYYSIINVENEVI